jgi:hypothetical protein
MRYHCIYFVFILLGSMDSLLSVHINARKQMICDVLNILSLKTKFTTNFYRGMFIDPIEINAMKVLLIHLCTYQLYMSNLNILKDN